MLLYVASDAPLRTIPWNDEAPAFHVDQMLPGDGTGLDQGAFAKPYVYVVGSSHKCACLVDRTVLPEPDELEMREAFVADLRLYLIEASSGGPIDVYACSTDDAMVTPGPRRQLFPSSASSGEFLCEPGERLSIHLHGAA